MLISELESLVSAAAEEVQTYDLYLACPDKVAADNADEQTATIGGVDLCIEQAQARLYPPFASVDGYQCYTLADLLSTLKDAEGYQPDLKLVAELPLIREESVACETTIVPVVQLHIGTHAHEAWLLLASPSEFPANSLPA